MCNRVVVMCRSKGVYKPEKDKAQNEYKAEQKNGEEGRDREGNNGRLSSTECRKCTMPKQQQQTQNQQNASSR